MKLDKYLQACVEAFKSGKVTAETYDSMLENAAASCEDEHDKLTKSERMQSLGTAAAKWRRAHGIYQSDIASSIDTCLPNISAFEHGNNDSSDILLQYMARGFNPMEMEELQWLRSKN